MPLFLGKSNRYGKFMKWKMEQNITKDIDTTTFQNSSIKDCHFQSQRQKNYLQNGIASIMRLV